MQTGHLLIPSENEGQKCPLQKKKSGMEEKELARQGNSEQGTRQEMRKVSESRQR